MSYFQRPEQQYRPRVQRSFSAPAGPRLMPAKFDSICPKCRQPIVADESMILWERGQKAVHEVCPAPVAVSPEAQAVAAFSALRGRLQVEDAGVYKLLDGSIVKVQANKEKSKVYAKRLVEHSAERATEAGARVHAEYVYEAGLIAQVEREGVKLSLDEAKALTIRYGFCIRCGRHLKAAQSVEQGMGPVCIKYFS